MRKALSYIGTLAFILQIASACTFAVLLHGERRDPSWHPGVLLNHWQGTMLNTSLEHADCFGSPRNRWSLLPRKSRTSLYYHRSCPPAGLARRRVPGKLMTDGHYLEF